MSDNESKDQKDGEGGKLDAKERLTQEIQKRLDEAKELQEKSIELHKQADETEDPEAADELEAEAHEADKKAAKLMKTAERLEAGWLQGGAMGTGIGAGLASGIGIAVGSLVTGVVAIPTGGLGMLIGAGTGLVHGPWAKFTDKFSKEEANSIVEEAQQEADKVAKSS
ncbi:hypothetical protein FZEAL_9969 [Fusarium zealandicum]|uniref:Uncharacterized protein n=1 Tax=Fusarium zealandicum TaxID=1053134 RepID=A0A8H4U732_9HYPO|nr:hypothetical protein FZEAL_9969 [Fusarium zealandicum]